MIAKERENPWIGEAYMVALDRVQFVVGQDGRPVAVQIDMDLWRQIVAALEGAEELALAKEALQELGDAGRNPEPAGPFNVHDLRDPWPGDDES
jgi:hypothetical protein